MKLDLGAGFKVNDGYTSVGLEDHHDIRADLRSLPLPDECASEAMAIHVIEHFNRWEVPAVLKEWKRVLKPGGLLVLEQPDLVKCCRNFLTDDDPQNGIMGIFGDPAHEDPLMLHKWGYTPHTLRPLLIQAGFVKVKQKPTQFHRRRANRDFRMEARKP